MPVRCHGTKKNIFRHILVKFYNNMHDNWATHIVVWMQVLKDTSIRNIPIINQEILWYQEKIDLYNLQITLLKRARYAYKGVKTNNIVF
jgi:hypothetical protein